MSYILKAILIFLILGAIFFSSSFSSASISLGGQIRGALALPFLFFKNMFLLSDLAESLVKANLENKGLRVEIVRLSLGLKSDTGNLISAKVYANYPFNDRGLLVLAKGSSSGVKVGDIVLVSRNIFLGKIIEVGDYWSEVETIFDLNKNIPARIGANGVAGLLTGGANPFVDMVDKSRKVFIKDPVYLASRDLPYGLMVGEVGKINEPTTGIFKSVDLSVPYSLFNLEEVLIMKLFK